MLGLFVCVIGLIGCSTEKIDKSDFDYKGRVIGTVVSKEYVPESNGSYTTYLGNGMYTTVDDSSPARYYVIIEYQNLREKVDDKELYDNVEVGYDVPVYHFIYKDNKYAYIKYK